VAAGIDLILLAGWFIVSRGFVLMLLRARGHRVRLLVLGPEESHRALAAEIRAHAPTMLDVITAEPNATNSYAESLRDTLAGGRVDQIVLADVALPQSELNALLAQCDRTDADVFLLPGIDMSIIANTRVCS